MGQQLLKRRHSYDELSFTCKKHYLPFIRQFVAINNETSVLEIGCGEGGILFPFTKIGCKVTGIDLDDVNIKHASEYLYDESLTVKLYLSDIYSLENLEQSYDVILVHEVIECIKNKKRFLEHLKNYLNPNGIVFMGFHAWNAPYGGSQYLCRNKLVSSLPFVHLLPARLLKLFLYHCCREELSLINQLSQLRRYKTSIEQIRNLLLDCEYRIQSEQIFFIEPLYEAKFNLRPRKLSSLIARIPHVRNFLSTGCFYILGKTNYYIQVISDGKIK